MKKAEGDRATDPVTLYRLLYSSKIAKSKSANEVESDIEHILTQSRISNATRGITGVLVTNRRMFTQIIEGPAGLIKDLIGHIACDSRHHDVRIVSHHRAEHRIFENWSMAFIHTGRDFRRETLLFPADNEQSNLMAISAFCDAVRSHLGTAAAP